MNTTLLPSESKTDKLLGTWTATVAMVTITGNLISMIAICSPLARRRNISKSLRKPHITLIFCLSFLDFCMGMFHLSFVAVACFTGRWLDMDKIEMNQTYPEQVLNGGTWCRISSFFIRPMLCMAIGTVSVIGLERTLVIGAPLRAPRILNNTRTMTLLSVFWLVSILLLFQELYFSHVTVYILPAFQCIPSYTRSRDVAQIIWTNTSYNFINFVIITSSSLYTVWTIVKLRFKNNLRGHKKERCTRMLLSVTILLIISVNTTTWLPQSVLSLLRYVLPAESGVATTLRDFRLRAIVWWLQYMSAAINPVIYALRLKVIREEIRVIYRSVMEKIFSVDFLDTMSGSSRDKKNFAPLGRPGFRL